MKDISAMEPMLVPEGDPTLDDLIFDLNHRSATLTASMAPEIQKELGRLVRSMNCYYSNFIEGSQTTPREIERALRNDFAKDNKKRSLQHEALAHIHVQELIDAGNDPQDLWPASDKYVRWLHREFCSRLPADMLVLHTIDTGRKVIVVPGEYRTGSVDVGFHDPPNHGAVPEFMRRFTEAYRSDRLSKPRQLMSVAAAHHRFAWIHPFADGNGRVARLMSHAMFLRLLGGHSLWSVSRGLARNAEKYKTRLAAADLAKRNSLDGRGALSLEELKAFCVFFLTVSIDQIDFMNKLLQPREILRRMEIYVTDEIVAKRLPKGSFEMLREAFYRGSFQRGQARDITGYEERRARETLSTLLNRGLLVTSGPRAPVSLGFPAEVLDRWLPNLYPIDAPSSPGA
jgi:Fic family protein